MKRRLRFYYYLNLIFGLILMLPVSSNAEMPVESPYTAEANQAAATRWRGGPQLGFSPYTGIIGGELQYGRFGMTLGMPTTTGFKYYLDESGISWFVGVHGMWFRQEDYDEEKDDITYGEREGYLFGTGFGYKWQFRTHWELSASLSLAYYEEKLSDAEPNDDRIDHYLFVFPGVSFGYTF